MIITAGQTYMNPVYGPRVWIDSGLRHEANRSVSIDTDALGENLQRDFPELTQADWDNNLVLVTDMFHKRIGGFTANVLSFRDSRSAQFIYGISRAVKTLASSIHSPVNPSAKWLLAQSKGHEVLTVLNLAADLSKIHDKEGFFTADNPLNFSQVLAHEIHHATGELLSNRILREQQIEYRRHANKVARYVGAVIGGGTAAFGGFLAAVETARDGVIPPLTSAGVMLGGVALAGAILHRGVTSDALSVEGTVLDIPDPEYGESERCANAYALASVSNWAGVVSL
jgi:hypothetical protein